MLNLFLCRKIFAFYYSNILTFLILSFLHSEYFTCVYAWIDYNSYEMQVKYKSQNCRFWIPRRYKASSDPDVIFNRVEKEMRKMIWIFD